MLPATLIAMLVKLFVETGAHKLTIVGNGGFGENETYFNWKAEISYPDPLTNRRSLSVYTERTYPQHPEIEDAGARYFDPQAHGHATHYIVSDFANGTYQVRSHEMTHSLI